MPKGLKPVRRVLADGSVKVYWYHRATGKPLRADPETAEGFVEVAGLDAKATAQTASVGLAAGSYALLWEKYRAGPEWRALKPRTRSDYQAVRDWLGEPAERAMLAQLTPGRIYAMRDRAAKERGRRFANYVVQVLRLTLSWGMRRDLCKANPARAVKLIPKPRGEAKVNRAWRRSEVDAFVAEAPFQLLVPFVLGLFVPLREADALEKTWTCYDGFTFRCSAGKNGAPIEVNAEGLFKEVLDAALARRGPAVQIAVTSTGTTWTQSGFRASFFKFVRRLQGEGKIQAGCTFHGLRHTVGTWASDAGECDARVAAAIGDYTPAMAAIYRRDADRRSAGIEVLGDIQKRFTNVDWKTRRTVIGK